MSDDVTPADETVADDLPESDAKPAAADYAAFAASVEDTPEAESSTDETTGREAAKFRKQLRAVEAERDAIGERLNGLQRAEAQRLAAERLGDGADLFIGGTELAAVLDDNGAVSAELVDKAVTAVLAQHPHWRRLHLAAPPASSVTSNGKITDGRSAPTWTEVLQEKIDR